MGCKLKFIFCLFCLSLGYAQNKTVSINWVDANDLLIESSVVNIKGADSFFVDDSGFVDKLISTWEPIGESYEGAKAVSVILEPVSLTLLNKVDKSVLPKSFSVSVNSRQGRDKIMEVMSFNPLVNIKGEIKRVVSFNLEKNKRKSGVLKLFLSLAGLLRF